MNLFEHIILNSNKIIFYINVNLRNRSPSTNSLYINVIYIMKLATNSSGV